VTGRRAFVDESHVAATAHYLLAAVIVSEASAEALSAATAVVADMPETDRLLATLEAWWPAIEVLIVTGVTNARTEATNTTIKNIKRTGRGFPTHRTTAPVSSLSAPPGVRREHSDQHTSTPNREEPKIQAVANALNHRPRKNLSWRTPAEALDEHLRSLQQAGVATTS